MKPESVHVTTGATAWDFLISLNLPIMLLIIAAVVGFCIANAEKLLAIAAAINALFARVSTRARKRHISQGIRSSVIASTKKIGVKDPRILPSDLQIKWADNESVQSFFDDDCVIVCLRQNADPNTDYINIIYHFVSRGLLRSQKHYFDNKIMEASTLLLTQKIVSFSKPGANKMFLDNLFYPQTQSDADVAESYMQLQRIDYNGMLFSIYLNELTKAAATIEGQIPDACLISESGEFLRYLFNIANRSSSDEHVDLAFKGVYFKVSIVLAANKYTLRRSGWKSHVNHATRLIHEGYSTIYVFGIGSKANIASEIARAVSEQNPEIVKTLTNKYRHLNAETGVRHNAVCVELDTY